MPSITNPRPPIVIFDPQPLPPEDLARLWFMRRTGASPSLAGVYVALTGLGARREGAAR